MRKDTYMTSRLFTLTFPANDISFLFLFDILTLYTLWCSGFASKPTSHQR